MIYDSLKELIDVFKTSIIIPISLILTTVLLVLDNDPPTFPLKPDKECIDCANIYINKLYGELSRIKVELHADEFVQFPREISSQLVRIQVKSNGIVQEFGPKQYWDLISNLSDVSWCVLNTIGGYIEVNMYCQNDILKSATAVMNDIEVYPIGWSRYLPSNKLLGRFMNVYVKKNGEMVFSIQPNTVFPVTQFSFDFQKKIVPNKGSAEDVRKKFSGQTHTTPVYAIYANASNAYEDMIEVLLPLIDALPPNTNDYNLMAARGQNLSRILSKFPENKIIRNDPKGKSFNEIRIITGTGVSMRYININFNQKRENHLHWVFNSFNEFNRLRNVYQPGVGKNVVIDEGASKFEKEISDGCKCKPKVITMKTPINTISSELSNGQVFVTTTPMSAVFAPFMRKGSTVVTIDPKNTECFNYGKTFFEKAGLKHYKLVQKQTCSCSQFDCRINSSDFSNVIRAQIPKVIEEAMK